MNCMRCLLKICIITLTLLTIGCIKSTNPSNTTFPHETTISGTYGHAPYPVNQEPALPCLVAAVVDEVRAYVLTVEGQFFCSELEWEEHDFYDGEFITVAGSVSEHTDLHDNVWYGLEIGTIIYE
jgi:hypothetical protein